MRRATRFFVIFVSIYAIASIAAGAILAEAALHPPRRRASVADAAEARSIAARWNGRVQDVAIQSADDVTLNGWFFTPTHGPTATVLVAHGVSAHRGHALALASVLLGHGYAVLAPDARGHGTSGGLASFGVRERDDLRAWVDWIASHDGGRCVVGVGASMGAAQLLQAAASEPRVCGVVAEASFATFREVALDRVNQHVGAGDWFSRTIARPAVEAGLLYARARYGLDLAGAEPTEALRAIRVPVLIIHGTADSNMPIRHARLLAAASPAARVWIVRGARHTEAWGAAPAEYPARVLALVREAADSR